MDGARWKWHRKIAANMFSRRLLQEGTGIALAQARKLERAVAAKAATGEPFDLQKCFFGFTMDVFGEIAFGVQLDSQQNDHRFTKAFDTVQAACNRRFTQPFWKFVRFLQCSADERAIKRETRVMRGFARDVIRAKRRTPHEEGGSSTHALLGSSGELRGSGSGHPTKPARPCCVFLFKPFYRRVCFPP